MVVISDTSPITNLMTIGKVDLLQQLFGKIIIPEGVKLELERLEEQKLLLRQLNWVRVQKVKDVAFVGELRTMLDRGESEAIALAIEKKADYLIIDERKGRSIAIQYGLKITGLLGVLTRAKTKGYIGEVKPVLESLILLSGFRVNPTLKKQILNDMGE